MIGSTGRRMRLCLQARARRSRALECAIRFGGWDNDVAYGIVVDAQGYATVAGATDSHDFPQFGSPRPVSRRFAAQAGSGRLLDSCTPRTSFRHRHRASRSPEPYDITSPESCPDVSTTRLLRAVPAGGPLDASVEFPVSAAMPQPQRISVEPAKIAGRQLESTLLATSGSRV